MNELKAILLVGFGGFAGAVLRYLAAGCANHLGKHMSIPVGTLAVNVVGCALIGVFGGLAQRTDWLTESTRLILVVGLLGGFTTFSAFGLEAVQLLRDREVGAALLYVSLHLILGVGATFLTFWLSASR